jgi:hypothetical protein
VVDRDVLLGLFTAFVGRWSFFSWSPTGPWAATRRFSPCRFKTVDWRRLDGHGSTTRPLGYGNTDPSPSPPLPRYLHLFPGTQRRRAGRAAPPEMRRRAVALDSAFITSRALLPRPLPLLTRSASHLSLIHVDPARSGEESASYQMICKLWSMLPSPLTPCPSKDDSVFLDVLLLYSCRM